jgi:hypothetical protein
MSYAIVLRFMHMDDTGTMQESVESLEAKLAEREQLVAALTERLEQAAEQLDRLHRTGADRSLRAGIAGIPPELVAQQQKLTEDLQRAVEQWEALQPGAFFGRLETQLSQIHDLVVHVDRGGETADSAFSSAIGRSGSSSFEQSAERRGSSDSPRSILEFMKASHLSEAAASEPAPTEATGDTTAPAAGALDIALPPLDDAPAPVDVLHATSEELGEACMARDAYITYLIGRLKQVESLGHVPNSWAGLENLPDELRARLDALEHRLQETARLAEVELSVQRAKLAREELRIRVMDEQMQKDIKRARDVSESQADDQGDSKGDQTGSRWKRMLGRRGGDA